MALSTFEIMLAILLTIGLGIAIWFYAVAHNYGNYINNTTYTRGANALKEGTEVQLTCDANKKISIHKATQICTAPDSNNFEGSNLEPFASGTSSDVSNVNYGDFDPATTVDMKSDMEKECNDKQKCTYKFVGAPFPGGVECNGNKQLIATYDCVPK
jgi:hypothetical protein